MNECIQQGSYVWVWQEKAKGRADYNFALASNHGGWKFATYYDVVSGFTHMAPAEASQLTDSALRNIPFFSFAGGVNAYSFLADLDLTTTNGSAYAQANRNRILSDAIPAITL